MSFATDKSLIGAALDTPDSLGEGGCGSVLVVAKRGLSALLTGSSHPSCEWHGCFGRPGGVQRWYRKEWRISGTNGVVMYCSSTLLPWSPSQKLNGFVHTLQARFYYASGISMVVYRIEYIEDFLCVRWLLNEHLDCSSIVLVLCLVYHRNKKKDWDRATLW